MTSSSSVRRVRAPGVLWREGDFGVVVLPSGGADPRTLVGTAPALWHALQQPLTDLALATELSRQFGVEPDRCAGRHHSRARRADRLRRTHRSTVNADPITARERAGIDPAPAPALAIAAHGLPDSAVGAETRLPGPPSTPRRGAKSSTDATRERTIPLLAIAVADGAFAATPDQRAAVVRAHEHVMRRCLLLDRALLETTDCFDAAGITVRALKGAAVAHLDYPDPSWRAYGDVDLLVASEHLDHAIELLVRAGGRRTVPEIHPGFDRRFGKGACVVRPDGIQVDVHRTFVAGPFGLTIDLADLITRSTTFTLGDRAVSTIDRESRFLHACYHAALGDSIPRRTALRDVAQLALAHPLDLERVLDRARSWRAESVVARAVTLSWNALDLAPASLSRWATSYRPDRFQARSLRAYTSDARSYATQTAAGIAAIPGVTAKAAYVRALVFADRRHVAARDGRYSTRIRRGWDALRSSAGTR